jgi:hypothetical protein
MIEGGIPAHVRPARLAFATARRRGPDPGRPGRIEQYHSQGPTHILGAAEAAT